MILEKYYNRDFVHTFINLTFFVLAIVLSNLLIKLFNEAYSNGFGISVVLKFVILTVPQNLAYLLPITTSLAITLGFGKFYSNNEMFVTLAGGVTWGQIIKSTFRPVIYIALAALAISMYILPFSKYASEVFQRSLIARTAIEAISDQKFIKLPDKDDLTAYIGKKENNNLQDVFLYQKNDGNKYTVITSPSGDISSQEKSSTISLNNANFYSIDSKTNETTYGKARKAEDIMYQNMPSIYAYRYDQFYPGKLLEKAFNEHDQKAQAELAVRIGAFFTIIISALLALSMCRLGPRQNKYVKLLPSVAVLSIYLSISMFMNTFMQSGKIPVWIGSWICHAFFAFFAIRAIRRQDGSPKLWRNK